MAGEGDGRPPFNLSGTRADDSTEPFRSPVRPPRAAETPPTRPTPMPSPSPSMNPPPESNDAPNTPANAMHAIRAKMERIADEFAQGRINRAQFNAMYARYSEQRTIIERLVERNPQSDAWKQVVATRGQTGFLRTYFEAQPVCFFIYAHSTQQPLIVQGKTPQAPNPARILPTLEHIWAMSSRPAVGLGRKPLSNDEWLILATGMYTATAVIFSLEPAVAQARLIRDLHADFERANQTALARNWLTPERMVFPQRALIETTMS